MKKKVLFLVMSMCILMLAGGCAKKGVTEDLGNTTDTATTEDTTDTTDTTTTDTTATDPAADKVLPKVEDYVASDYITLGQYKGVEVSVKQLTVTDESVDAAINDQLAASATQEDVTGRAVQDGDIVNIDYEGLLDGVAFDGGTATGSDLEIGSNSFIEGFESGLIGANIGDTVALNLTFPESYSNTEMAGKAVVFNVKINSIKQNIIPELTVEYVTANTDYDTIDAFKESVRAGLETSNQDTMENEKATNIMTAILGNSTIIQLPQTLVDYYTAQIKYSFESEAYGYGMDIETYVSSYGMTMDDYTKYVGSLVEAYSQRDLLINAVAQAEALDATDDELATAVTDYLSYYNVTTEDELYALISKDEIKSSVVMQKAYDFIIDNAVVTVTTATN